MFCGFDRPGTVVKNTGVRQFFIIDRTEELYEHL